MIFVFGAKTTAFRRLTEGFLDSRICHRRDKFIVLSYDHGNVPILRHSPCTHNLTHLEQSLSHESQRQPIKRSRQERTHRRHRRSVHLNCLRCLLFLRGSHHHLPGHRYSSALEDPRPAAPRQRSGHRQIDS